MGKKQLFWKFCLLILMGVPSVTWGATATEPNRSPRSPLARAAVLLDAGEETAVEDFLTDQLTEGNAEVANRVRALLEFYNGNPAGAKQALELVAPDAWSDALTRRVETALTLQRSWSESTSDHFVVRVSSADVFLAEFALSSLETTRAHLETLLPLSSSGPVQVEIHPDADSLSRSSAPLGMGEPQRPEIALHKFGRLMVLSPGAVPGGYRWLDELNRLYVDLMVRRIAGPLPAWLSEGLNRTILSSQRESVFSKGGGTFFISSATVSTTTFSLTEWDTLPPSLSLDEIEKIRALASRAVSDLVEEFGWTKMMDVLAALKKSEGTVAFETVLGVALADWEKNWRDNLFANPPPPPAEDTAALFRTAQSHWVAQRLLPAENILKRILAVETRDIRPFLMAADLFFDDGRYEEAQNALLGAIEINPFHSKIHEILGLIAMDVGQFAKARQSLLLARRLDPANEAVTEALRRMPKNR